MKLYIDFYERESRLKKTIAGWLLFMIVLTFLGMVFALFFETKGQTKDSLYESQVIKLADLRVNDIYSNFDFYKLNSKINYYGKNINQILITVEDTLNKQNNSLNYYVWQKYITIRKVDSLVIRIIEKWSGKFEEW